MGTDERNKVIADEEKRARRNSQATDQHGIHSKNICHTNKSSQGN